jgi:hypothetical protein
VARSAQRLPSGTPRKPAHTLRFWQPIVIPGLLQVEPYAYEIYRATGRGHERAVDDTGARMARQAILLAFTAEAWNAFMAGINKLPLVLCQVTFARSADRESGAAGGQI